METLQAVSYLTQLAEMINEIGSIATSLTVDTGDSRVTEASLDLISTEERSNVFVTIFFGPTTENGHPSDSVWEARVQPMTLGLGDPAWEEFAESMTTARNFLDCMMDLVGPQVSHFPSLASILR